MKILIITSFFPPQNSVASLRPYSWAKYWSLAGHDVTVLTVPKKVTSSDLDLPFDGFRVIAVPIPGMAWLASKLAKDQEIELQKNNPNVISALKKQFNLKNTFRKFLSGLQSKYGIASTCRMPDTLDLWPRAARRALGAQKWDLVVSTSGPYGVHAPAYTLRRKGHAKRWIADWRDLWVDNHIFPGLPVFRVIEKILEKRWCMTADAVTTVSEPLAFVLGEKYHRRVDVIYNGFDPDDYKKIPKENAFPDDDVLRIIYTGSIYSGYRDPTPLFKAIYELNAGGQLTPKMMQILFCGANANLNNLAEREGVNDYVKYLGIVPRNKALQLQRDASILLLLEFESDTVKGILTGKLFEYLFAGPVIWGVGVGNDSSVGKVLRETARGMAFGSDIKAIKREILLILNNKNYFDKYRLQNENSLKLYNRSTQAIRLLEC